MTREYIVDDANASTIHGPTKTYVANRVGRVDVGLRVGVARRLEPGDHAVQDLLGPSRGTLLPRLGVSIDDARQGPGVRLEVPVAVAVPLLHDRQYVLGTGGGGSALTGFRPAHTHKAR